MLATSGVPGIAGIDTRRLTRIIRDTGAIPGAFGSVSEAELLDAARREPGTDGVDLVGTVTTPERYTIASVDPASRRRIVAIDYGMKRNIGRHLARLGTVEVVPAATSGADILALAPGRHVPEQRSRRPRHVRPPGRGDHRPARAGSDLRHLPRPSVARRGRSAPSTVKMPFGHHGGNHPVQNLASGRVEITSQNHNFAVDAGSFGDRATMTHVNLNDGVCEGLQVTGELAFSVQHHPEANPGPSDANYLFEQFADMMTHHNSGNGAR